MATLAHINPALLSWARERAGLTQHALAEGLPVKSEQVVDWEAGNSMPTFKQAQRWAAVTHVPFGFLFLPAPPAENLPLPDLRTVDGQLPDKPSTNLLDTVREVLNKQAWYVDYLRDQERSSLSFVGHFDVRSSVRNVVEDMRLKLEVDTNGKNGDEYLRQLIRAAETLGILVMRSGIVGTNTHRKLDVGEFRGFAVSDSLAPIVFINSADAPTARLFTLIHELAHIWIGSSGISNVSQNNHRREEVFCNAVAGEFLVPKSEFETTWKKTDNWREGLAELAAKFHVSALVIARRASDLGYVSREEYSRYYIEELQAYRQREKNGGSFYRNAGAKNSVRFSRAVIAEAMSGRLLLRDAGKLLGVQPAKIRTYAETLAE
ncbi:ImmA/IrrE family metallo-endopeptidase [Paraburkholderia caffeinilytica]|uniref:ImmA/IrrE family metallo-endopeptidase n=1 Tax=Paraburkholderia caffeinilytica TaxID=1761016 RepID=UPI0038B8A514